MGVINITPDSFSPLSRVSSAKEAFEKAQRFLDAGMDILDIGAESTRPGFAPITTDTELERILPVLDLVARLPVPLSIDTRNPAVMERAMDYSPLILNDTGGLEKEDFLLLMKKYTNLLGVVMDGAGSGVSNRKKEQKQSIAKSVSDYFQVRLTALSAAGISTDRLLFDPGIGFGKNTPENIHLIRHIHELIPGYPILLGVSRKKFLGEITKEESPENRDPQTLSVMAFVFDKISIFRVHAVKAAVDFRNTLNALREGSIHHGA
jgi:dihydropteroate synthase